MDRVNNFFLQNAMKGNVLSTAVSHKELRGTKEEKTADSKFGNVPVKSGKDTQGAKGAETDLKQLQSQHNLQQDKVDRSPENAIKKFFGKADELFETAKKAAPEKTEKGTEAKDKNVRAGGYKFNFSTKGGKLLLSSGTLQWMRNEPGKMQDFNKMLQGQFIQTQSLDPRTARQILDGVTRQLNDIAKQLGTPDSQQVMNALNVLSNLLSSFIKFDTKKKLQKTKNKKTKGSMKGKQYKELEDEEESAYGNMERLGQKISWFQNLEGMVDTELEQLEYDPKGGPRRDFLRKALTIVRDIKVKLLSQSVKEFQPVE